MAGKRTKPALTIERFDRPTFWALVGYKPRSPAVVRFHASNARMKIACSPARTSKSYSGSYDVAPDCIPPMVRYPDGRYLPLVSVRGWIVAPKYELAKEFEYLWDIFVDGQKRYFPGLYTIEKARNSPDQGAMEIVMNFGNDPEGKPVRSIIEVRSAAHMKSIQADQADWVIMSEAADQPEEVWSKYVSTRYGRAVLPTTPKIEAEWLRREIDRGEERPELRIETFYFDGSANPTYDWERYWIEHAKAESSASCPPNHQIDLSTVDTHKPPSKDNGHDCARDPHLCWASRNPHFAEQFLGRWTQAEGRILPFRLRPEFPGQTVHVLDRMPSWAEFGKHYTSVDYGFDDPSAVGWFTVGSDGTVILYDLIYERGLTASDLSRRVKHRIEDKGYWQSKFNWRGSPKIEWCAGDPQNPNVRAEFSRVGMRILVCDKMRQRDKTLGRLVLQDYLADDPAAKRPKFFIHRSCTPAIDELRLLRRKNENSDEDHFAGRRDHAYDMIRYLLTVLPKGRSVEEQKDLRFGRHVQRAQYLATHRLENGVSPLMVR